MELKSNFEEVSVLKRVECNTPATFKFKGTIEKENYLLVYVFKSGTAKLFLVSPKGESVGEPFILKKRKKKTSFNFFFPFNHEKSGRTFFLYVPEKTYHEVKVRAKKIVKPQPSLLGKFRDVPKKTTEDKLDEIASLLKEIKNKL